MIITLLLLSILANIILAVLIYRRLTKMDNFKVNEQSYLYVPQEHLAKGRRRKYRRKKVRPHVY